MAVVIEAGVCKPGNVCPERRGPFEFKDIASDALKLIGVCKKMKKGMPIGLGYREALKLQRSTLTGFIILSLPLYPFLEHGLDATKMAVEALMKTEPWEARTFLKTLSEIGLSHFKRVEGDVVDATKWYLYAGNLWDLFVHLSRKDHLFKVIAEEYSLVLSVARYLLENGFTAESVREAQRFVLSQIIDSLVARKHGYYVALKLMKAAREGEHAYVIEKYGLNPGTAADVIGTAILLALAEERKE